MRFFSSGLVIFSFFLFTAATLIAATDSTPQTGGTQLSVLNSNEFNGYKREHFKIDGRNAWVTLPKTSAPGKPWFWRARFPGFHDDVDLALLKRGWHTAYVDCANLYGGPDAMRIFDMMYNVVTQHYKLNPKAVLCGVSRGGLFIYNFANLYPERVAVLYGDTPVLDFKSWPAGNLKGKRSDEDWTRLKNCYGFKSDSEAFASQKIPMAYAKTLAEKHIPILHIVGKTDVVVPPETNSYPFAERYRKAGGRIVMHATTGPGEGHHIPLDYLNETVAFVEENTALPDLPEMKDWVTLNRGIVNAFEIFKTTKKGRVVFLGGSITHNPGWQNMTMNYLRQQFPECQFEFRNAGIPSLGAVSHAFRHKTDCGGPADLVFFESAVNDIGNGHSDTQIALAYEGVIRSMLSTNPKCDIVTLQFAEPRFTPDYQKGVTPKIIALHAKIENHYGVPSINLAKEVADRLAAGQFSWANDFKDLHPSQFGQRLYYQAIKKLFDQSLNVTSALKSNPLPPPLSAGVWAGGQFLLIDKAEALKGFKIDSKWTPQKGETRAGFVKCPMLVGEKDGDSFKVTFEGTVFGLMTAAGHDAGIIEWSVDDGPWKSKDGFTIWSHYLHIPFAFVLEPELPKGTHTVTVRIRGNNGKSALRIRNILINP